jgi:hypothetical protein
MTTAELREIEQISWEIKAVTRKVNDVAWRMSATSDEIKALCEEFGIQPQRPRLKPVDAKGDDDGQR